MEGGVGLGTGFGGGAEGEVGDRELVDAEVAVLAHAIDE